MLLILAFLIGLVVDIASDTMGLNTASTVFIAFIRPLVLRSLSPRDGYETGTFPRIHYMGLNWFLKYVVVLVFVHQFVYYLLADFGFEHFGGMLIRIFIGTFISLLLIVVSQYIIYRK
jgi:hypothetical protein